MSAPRRMVVAMDGSAGARAALAWALDMAVASGAEVVAVHALGLLTHLGAAPEPSATTRDASQEALEREWCAAMWASGVPGRCMVVDGNPVTAVLGAARDLGADLVVVGRRGHGGFPGLLLGSTSHQLVQHAALPVVVVPETPPD